MLLLFALVCSLASLATAYTPKWKGWNVKQPEPCICQCDNASIAANVVDLVCDVIPPGRCPNLVGAQGPRGLQGPPGNCTGNCSGSSNGGFAYLTTFDVNGTQQVCPINSSFVGNPAVTWDFLTSTPTSPVAFLNAAPFNNITIFLQSGFYSLTYILAINSANAQFALYRGTEQLGACVYGTTASASAGVSLVGQCVEFFAAGDSLTLQLTNSPFQQCVTINNGNSFTSNTIASLLITKVASA